MVRGAALALLLALLVPYAASAPLSAVGGGRHYYVYEFVVEHYENGQLVMYDKAKIRFEEINSTAFKAEVLDLNKSGIAYFQLASFLAVLNRTDGIARVYDGVLSLSMEGVYIASEGLERAVSVAGSVQNLVREACDWLTCVKACRQKYMNDPEKLKECEGGCGTKPDDIIKEMRDDLKPLDAALYDQILGNALVSLRWYCGSGNSFSISVRQDNGLYIFSLLVETEEEDSKSTRVVDAIYSQSGWLINATYKDIAEYTANNEQKERVIIYKITLVDTDDEAVKSTAATTATVSPSAESGASLPAGLSPHTIGAAIAIIGVAAAAALSLRKLL